jgi:hypothetical protein
MLDVLQPLEVANGYTTGIAKHIGQELHSFLSEYLLSSFGGGPIGSLNNEFTVEFVGIPDID